MALKSIGLFGNTATPTLPDRNAERLVNFYLDVAPQGSNPKTKVAPVGTPALKGYTPAFGAAGGTGVWTIATAQFVVTGYPSKERTFFVSGQLPSSAPSVSALYETNGLNDISFKGNLFNLVPSNIGPWKIVPGTTQLLIIGNGSGQVFNPGPDTMTTNLGANFPGAIDASFQDGYFAVIPVNSQQFYISAYQDATQWDALDYALENDQPDILIAIRSYRREFWVFGQTRTEIWSNTGNPLFPFQRNSNAGLRIGCMANTTVQVVGDSIMWAGRDTNGGPGIYRAQGYNAQKVSTPAIDRILADSIIADQYENWTTLTFRWNGQDFYAISVFYGATQTRLYNATTGFWSEWSYGANPAADSWPMHIAACATYSKRLGKVLIGTRTQNLVFSLEDQASDNGITVWRMWQTTHQGGYGQRQFFSRFLIDATPGNNYTLQWSDSYSSTSLALGTPGWTSYPYQPTPGGNLAGSRILWTRLGSSYNDRVWRVIVADDTTSPTVINDAMVDDL